MKEMVLFDFPKEESHHAIVYNLIKIYDLKVNIIRASIDFNARGFLLGELEGDEAIIERGIEYAREHHVIVNVIDSAILVNEEKCVNCGACTAVCTVDALYLDKNYELTFDNDKCIDCKLCVTACPARAIDAVL